MEALEKFIKENNLNFTGSRSSINSDNTIISGYALSLGITNRSSVKEAITAVRGTKVTNNRVFIEDLISTHRHACNNSYGEWWKHKTAKKLYKF